MELPKRKQIRLKDYDYSQNGCYFITICTDKNSPILSSIPNDINVGWGLAPTVDMVKLSAIGKICENEFLNLTNRFTNIVIDKYVIMPTHIHAIIVIDNSKNTVGASPTLH